jgi:DNA-binding GntR family transcriptional regulator
MNLKDALHIKRPDSLSKIAKDHIRRGIVTGEFALGESLQEVKLVSALGISKTPIREALAALKLQGLVNIIPQRGAFVFTLTKKDVIQLCRFRLILETAALDQALDEQPLALLHELEEIISKMSLALECDEFEQYLELDADFHDAFFDHCSNNYLRAGYQKVSDIVRTMRSHLSTRPERTVKSFEEHRAIVTFLREGNVKKANSVLKKQITRGERSYSDLTGIEQT